MDRNIQKEEVNLGRATLYSILHPRDKMKLLIALIGIPKLRSQSRGVTEALRIPPSFTMEEPQTLRSLFASAKAQKSSLGSRADTNTEAYRDEVNAAISKFQECQRQVSILSLFSNNELLEDVSTGDLQ